MTHILVDPLKTMVLGQVGQSNEGQLMWLAVGHNDDTDCVPQAAPYDVLIADEALSHERLHTALGAAAMWTTSHCMPLLPYSCVVLESVPEAEARARMPPPWNTTSQASQVRAAVLSTSALRFTCSSPKPVVAHSHNPKHSSTPFAPHAPDLAPADDDAGRRPC